MNVDLCFGCMERFTAYPCPRCGYDPRAQTLDYALRPGTILNGKYLVGKVLGQGGFGITYIGWDLALERKVAVKEYFPSGCVGRSGTTLHWYGSQQAQAARESGMEMFLKEARKMSRVDNVPGVVRVRDLFQENGTAYIVMDFIEGRTLMDRLKERGPLSWEEAKEIFLPAIRTMDRVHQAGLVHRDLSPDNLMLEPDGGVKILDLGAAKDLNINSGASSMQVAKKGFSPLEQYTQRGGSGPWTDVYAMAATMYYALTGVLPPPAVDRMEDDRIDWTLRSLTSLPIEAVLAIKKALVLSSKNRTQSMAELEQALHAAVEDKSRKDGRAGKMTRRDDTAQRKRSLKPAAIAAVVVVLVTAAALVMALGGGRQSGPLPSWEDNVMQRGSYTTNVLNISGTDRTQVATVTFLDTVRRAPSQAWDVSRDGNRSVLAWMEPSGSLYDLYIAADGGINAEIACTSLFQGFSNLRSVDFNGCFHTDNAVSMSFMFANCVALKQVDLTQLDTSSVQNVSYMLYGCDGLEKIVIQGVDLSGVRRYGSFMRRNATIDGRPWLELFED